jgi:hypothetical protein
LFSADEIIALLTEHGSKRRPWTRSTRGCGPQTSMSFSPWSVTEVDRMYASLHRGHRVHRGNRLGVCCLTILPVG